MTNEEIAEVETNVAEAVAAGNGLEPHELPEFVRHVHAETGDTDHVHESWFDCHLTMCTWAGHTAIGRLEYVLEAPAGDYLETLRQYVAALTVATRPTPSNAIAAGMQRTLVRRWAEALVASLDQFEAVQ